MEDKVYKEEEVKEAINAEHKEDISKIDLQCEQYKKKESVPNDESEQKEMDVFEDKDEIIETFFQRWSQEKIRFYYQEIREKDRQEYEAEKEDNFNM